MFTMFYAYLSATIVLFIENIWLYELILSTHFCKTFIKGLIFKLGQLKVERNEGLLSLQHSGILERFIL